MNCLNGATQSSATIELKCTAVGLSFEVSSPLQLRFRTGSDAVRAATVKFHGQRWQRHAAKAKCVACDTRLAEFCDPFLIVRTENLTP